MKRKKTKRMLRPYELWNPGVVERWLEEEAAAGWYLTDWSGWRVKFEAAEPKSCRVRVYPQSEPEAREAFWARLEVYEEMGWRFAAAVDRDYEVFYCDDPAVPELFSDPSTYALAWDKQLDRARAMSIVMLVLAAIMEFAITAVFFVRAGSFLQGLLDMTLFFWLLLLLVWPVVAALAVRQLLAVRKLRRQIAAEIKPAADPDWRKRRRRWKILVVLYALYWIFFVFRDVTMFFELDTDGLPYVTVSELQPETDEKDWGIDSWENYVCYGTVLRPVRYEIQLENEACMVRNESHRLRFEFLARALYRERCDRLAAELPGAAQLPVRDAAFDEAVVLKHEEKQVLLVRAGRIVYALHTNLPVELAEQVGAVTRDLQCS